MFARQGGGSEQAAQTDNVTLPGAVALMSPGSVSIAPSVKGSAIDSRSWHGGHRHRADIGTA